MRDVAQTFLAAEAEAGGSGSSLLLGVGVFAALVFLLIVTLQFDRH